MEERISQGRRPVFLLSKRRVLAARFELWLLFVAILGAAALQPAILRAIQPELIAMPYSPSGSIGTMPDQAYAAAGSTATAPTPDASTAVAMTAAATAPSCSRNPQYSTRLSDIDLGSYDEGLTMVNDAPLYYPLTASSPDQLRAMMLACGPNGDFAGQTAYTINWSYALRRDDTGLCQVVSSKVGIHTGMLLPDNASPQRSSAWSAFAQSLATHENGHISIADQYGAKLLAALRTYPGGDCYTMGPGVDNMAQSIASQLDAAQGQYDTATGHGTTQGASL